MASPSTSVFSQALQEITSTKLDELSKRRTNYENTKAQCLSRLANESSPLQRLKVLSYGVKECYSIRTSKTGEIVSTHSPNPNLELELKHLDAFLKQTEYDPSVSNALLKTWEDSLLRHLDTQSSKYQYASLYAQLVTEWLSADGATETAPGEDISMGEGFEDVSNSLKKEAQDQWAKSVFEPADVNEANLKLYLSKLFDLGSANENSKTPIAEALEQTRKFIAVHEHNMAQPNQFTTSSLNWTIDGLLNSELLTEEKREVLRDFKRNPIILSEVADVLNMRMAAFSSWSWGDAVALEQRRNITGVYNILMHENVLQAIFLYYIGVSWSVALKGFFRLFRKSKGAWKSHRITIPKIDRLRRDYYMLSCERDNSVQEYRKRLNSKFYFMESLMTTVSRQTLTDEGEVEAEYSSAPIAQTLQALQPQQTQQTGSNRRYTGPSNALQGNHALQDYQMQLMLLEQQNKKRLTMARQEQDRAPEKSTKASGRRVAQQSTADDNYDSDEWDDNGTLPASPKGARRPMQDKQRLVRLLSTEIAVNTELHGELTAFHGAFESWYSLLPHETILAIMEFLGVSKPWMDFFAKFLRAPLKFLDDSPDKAPRTRLRGTPSAHVLSEVFSESVFFCLELAINRATGGKLLHRMHDDFYFWSTDHGIAKTAWATIEEFTDATRTRIHHGKTGTVRISRDPNVELEIDGSLPKGEIRWGFLQLSPKTGKFEIDQGIVDKHIVDLRRQLADKKRSVISFIQTWNTFAATFFTSNFGKAANCFGRDHVDQMLKIHGRIQQEIFAPSDPAFSLLTRQETGKPVTNVVDYIKMELETRFNVADIPDAYLYFPIELGGLDLRSPFISILPLREAVLADPAKELDKYLIAERRGYEDMKTAWEEGEVHLGRTKHGVLASEQNSGEIYEPEDGTKFMSFEEFTRYREDINETFDNSLINVFRLLLKGPDDSNNHDGRGIETPSPSLRNALAALDTDAKGISTNFHSMTPYWRWVAQMYGPEAIERFGGLRIVEKGLLPMGMVGMFRDRRVTWQG